MHTQEVRNQGFVGILVWTAIMLVISSLVYRFIEEPARKRLRPKRKPVVLPVAAEVAAD
jgi:peptidoglycan/LPS O-acetylase OafA/YrhL